MKISVLPQQASEKSNSHNMPPRKRKQAARKTDADPPPDPPAAASSSSGLNPAKMTVAKLREELERRGLDTQGKKAELVARLQADIEAEGETAAPAAKKTKTEVSCD